MKLANCGRCGLEAETVCEDRRDGNGFFYPALYGCPVAHGQEPVTLDEWNAAQFAARTERINAAAVAITSAGFGDADYFADVVSAAVRLIDAQDAAARSRWAEMQLSPVVDHCTCPPLELDDGSVEERCSGSCAYYKAMKGGGK